MEPKQEHHTPEQVEAAFKTAPIILRKLINAGIPYPKFELFADASGTLILGKEGEVTGEQFKLATNLIHSVRQRYCGKCLTGGTHSQGYKHDVAIQFCCGLVVESGGHENIEH